MSVVIETTLGDLTVDLFLEQRPRACLNFLKLCKMKYYNFSLFHSIQSGFIAQTGDPTATGSGGESIWGLLEGEDKRYFTAERVPRIRHSDVGMLSMVCAGDSLVGSQFFFTLGPDLDSLDSMHCVIGVVTEGHDVLRQLNEVICDEGYRPYRDVRVTHTVVLEDPFDDPKGLLAPSHSPSPSAERLVGGRIAPDEEIDETQGKTLEEINELIEDKEAKARATILEIVGDLPDADVAPPENVLFVCKLNPVTTDSDLEIIFSRFGKIVNCEIIRDRKTGDSLQYAFIEFEDKKSCESAYFKMDNVLIDDRRIHVDFSQSVSKVKYFGKGRIQHMNDSDIRNVDVTGDRKRQRSKSKDINIKNNKERNFNDRKTEMRHNSRERDEKRHHQDNRRKNRSHSRDRHKRNHNRSRRSHDRSRKSRDRSRSRNRHRRSQDRTEREKMKNQGRSTTSSSHKDQENRKGTDRPKLRRSKSQSPIQEPHSSKRGNSGQKNESKVIISQAEISLNDNRSHRNVNNSIKGKQDSASDNNTDDEKIKVKSTKTKKMSRSGHKTSNDIPDDSPSKKQSSLKNQGKNQDKYKRKLSDLKAEESHKSIKKENKEHHTKDIVKGSKEASEKKLKAKSDKLKKKIVLKKRCKHSTSSSSSDSSSSSSSSDSSSSESDCRNKRSTKKKKRKCSTSSSSSPTESSSSSESDSSSDSSSTSSSSEGEVRKKKKLLKKKKIPVKKSKIDKKNT